MIGALDAPAKLADASPHVQMTVCACSGFIEARRGGKRTRTFISTGAHIARRMRCRMSCMACTAPDALLVLTMPLACHNVRSGCRLSCSRTCTWLPVAAATGTSTSRASPARREVAPPACQSLLGHAFAPPGESCASRGSYIMATADRPDGPWPLIQMLTTTRADAGGLAACGVAAQWRHAFVYRRRSCAWTHVACTV